MSTPNVGVYECRSCGSIVEQELCCLPPFCCGIEMAKSGKRTVSHDGLVAPLSISARWVKTVGRRVADCESPSRAEFAVKQTL